MSNYVLGTGLTFTQLVVAAIIFIGGVIAVKVTFNFDLNKYLGSRHEKLKAKCQNACLHFEFVKNTENQVEVSSFFVSPPGTLNYICQRCALVSFHLDESGIQRQVDYYSKNIHEYKKMNKRFRKILKKSGQV